VRGGLVQRQAVLAAAALLGIVAALVIASLSSGSSTPEAERLPDSVPAPTPSGWYETITAPYRLPAGRDRTTCNHAARPEPPGIGHPTLPCGVKLWLEVDDRRVLTQVVDRGTGRPGREFDLTAPLAQTLGVTGIRPIRWRYAR